MQLLRIPVRQPLKKILLRLVITTELLLFLIYLFWGARGVQEICHVRSKNSTLMREVALIQSNIDSLQDAIYDWQRYPYYQEQYAREQLQLAKKHDEIYLI